MRGPGFSVRNRTLLAIAGSVWLAAGGNVARIGVQAYRGLPRVGAVHLLLSLVVFGLFGSMFFPDVPETHPADPRVRRGDPALLAVL